MPYSPAVLGFLFLLLEIPDHDRHHLEQLSLFSLDALTVRANDLLSGEIPHVTLATCNILSFMLVWLHEHTLVEFFSLCFSGGLGLLGASLMESVGEDPGLQTPTMRRTWLFGAHLRTIAVDATFHPIMDVYLMMALDALDIPYHAMAIMSEQHGINNFENLNYRYHDFKNAMVDGVEDDCCALIGEFIDYIRLLDTDDPIRRFGVGIWIYHQREQATANPNQEFWLNRTTKTRSWDGVVVWNVSVDIP